MNIIQIIGSLELGLIYSLVAIAVFFKLSHRQFCRFDCRWIFPAWSCGNGSFN